MKVTASSLVTSVAIALGLALDVAAADHAFKQRSVRDGILNPLRPSRSRQDTVIPPSFDADVVAKLNSCSGTACTTTLSFKGDAAKAFEVTQHLPGIPFQVPTSWAGNIPVNKSTPDQQLWFWLWGSEVPSDTLTIWINGGPGCSSMYGALTENGHIIFDNVETGPYRNPKRWSQVTSMLFIDQPVGVGYSSGPPMDQNEADAARNFGGFLDNFFETFPELKSKKLYLTGESYAGVYTQMIAQYELARGNPHKIEGIMVVDGVLDLIENPHESLTAYDYAVHYRDLLALNDTDIAALKQISDACGYTDYTAKNLVYPRDSPLPPYNTSYDACDVFNPLWDATISHYSNQDGFNPYNIGTREVFPPSILENGINGSSTWLSSDEVKKALHTSMKGDWLACVDVFNNYTSMPPETLPTMTQFVEGFPKVMWVHGMHDMRLLVNGTKLYIQGTEWRGGRGFSTPPTAILYDEEGIPVGKYQTERGASLATVDNSGHMVPGDAKSAGLALLKFLLGQGELGTPASK